MEEPSPKNEEIQTKKPKMKEIIGMTLPGIEDYTNDYDSEDYSESASSDVTTTLSVAPNRGMIRESFQVLPNAFKLGALPLPLSALSMTTSIENDDRQGDKWRIVSDDGKEEEFPNDDQLVAIDKSITTIIKSIPQTNTNTNTNNHTNYTSMIALDVETNALTVLDDLELAEDSDDNSTTDGSSSEEEDSSSDDSDDDEDDDDDDDDSKEESSSWGPGEDSIDEGAITYLSALTQQPDPNTQQFVFTPFDNVIDESQRSLKGKYNKITYPTGSKFYSKDLLETEGNIYHRLQNIQLVKWIKSNSFDIDDNDNDEKNKEKNENMKKISLRVKTGEDIFQWLKKSINKVYAYYKTKNKNDLKSCFRLIDGSVFEHFSGDNYKLMLRPEETENYKLFKLFELLLDTFARLSTQLDTNPTVSHKFYYYLEHTKKIFPKFKIHLDLLKETHKAHVNKHNANHCIQSFVQIYFQYQHFKFEDNRPEFELACKALVALDLYMENYSPLNHSILSDAAAYDINHESFKWLDGYNNIKYKLNKGPDIDDDKGSDTDEEIDIDTQHDDRLHLLKLELCSDPGARINKLVELYTQFKGFSFLRARISWVIGHSKLYHQRNFYHAEKYFFESLYVLKKLCQYEYFPMNSTMETPLASLVLIDYADVLLENKKYRYAINALEKVIDCLELRKQWDERFQIIRKLCITCTEKEDWARAIKYHNITLKKLKDNYLNLNEFVYLSQQVSTIHLKLNNFAQSEKELQNGIKKIYLNVLSYHASKTNNKKIKNINSITINKIFELCEGEDRIAIGSLILVLSNLYISGGNYLQQAINLLTYLRKNIFTSKSSTRRILILFQLARAYFKHGRYEIADNIIEKEILSRYPSKNDKLLHSLEFIQLRILILIKREKYDSALKLLDPNENYIISEIIKKESFVKRAKINYLKGRILQQRIFNKLVLKYEREKEKLKLYKKRESAKQSAKIIITSPLQSIEEEDKKTEINTTLNASISQIIRPQHQRGGGGGGHGFAINPLIHQQSMASIKESNPLDAQTALLLSHSDFRLRVQDPIMQAKCCLELGKTYLEIIMEYYAIPRFVLNESKCSSSIIKWLGIKIFDGDTTPNNEVIIHCLDEIDKPLYTALNLSIKKTKDISLLVESYISLAEFEFLKYETSQNKIENNNQKSKNFWQQSKITFFSTYKDSNDWIFLRRIDRHSRLQIFELFGRILRLLICYDNKFISDNVEIFVSYISLETYMVAQNDIYKTETEKSIKQKKVQKIQIPQNNKSKDFSRYNSATIYKNSYNIQQHEAIEKEEQKEEIIIKNPTITFRMRMEEEEEYNTEESDININSVGPLYPRYKQKIKGSKCELYLDELFRMHWKMRTDSNQFSGVKIDRQEIDNDKSLVSITKCISELSIIEQNSDKNSTLNRKYRSWKANEIFIISLNSIIFMFHSHTLFKYAIHKSKKNTLPNYSELKLFSHKLTNIGFHDNDYLLLQDNPWICNNKFDEQKYNNKQIKKKQHNLSLDKNKLLLTEISLPYLKLESISELLMCLDPQNILSVFGAIFSECQIIFISKERCRCLAIIDALFVLMYPFSWQYICIPWLSSTCFDTLKLPIPYIFGIPNIKLFNNILINNKYQILDKTFIIDLDTNNNLTNNKKIKYNQLPSKIKSKLTRAMFRLMSGLLKNSFINKTYSQRVFPPRRRDNISSFNNKPINILNKYNLLISPYTKPISKCSERRKWYKNNNNNNFNLQKELVINFQKEFCVSWVELLEQYRLFWVNINSALHKDLKLKSTDRIQKYAHPRYRKFLTEIQKTRMFSSFQCIRSLASTDMLTNPMFDNLVMKSLKWRQSLYHEIIQQQQQEFGKMRVSIENSKKRYFINHICDVIFDPKDCKLFITPHTNFINKQTNQNLLPFEVILKATDYEIESNTGTNINLHPYIDPKQTKKYGQRYQFKIKHQKDGILTLNCKNYYQLTRWIHMIRTHSMDTWSWFLKF